MRASGCGAAECRWSGRRGAAMTSIHGAARMPRTSSASLRKFARPTSPARPPGRRPHVVSLHLSRRRSSGTSLASRRDSGSRAGWSSGSSRKAAVRAGRAARLLAGRLPVARVRRPKPSPIRRRRRAERRPDRPAATPRDYAGSLGGTPVFLGCSDIDDHIPMERVQESAAVFGRIGAKVDARMYPAWGTRSRDEIEAVERLFAAAVQG